MVSGLKTTRSSYAPVLPVVTNVYMDPLGTRRNHYEVWRNPIPVGRALPAPVRQSPAGSEVGKDFRTRMGGRMSLVCFLAVLSCTHQVRCELDEKPTIGSREFCPECFADHVVVRTDPYVDEDVA